MPSKSIDEMNREGDLRRKVLATLKDFHELLAEKDDVLICPPCKKPQPIGAVEIVFSYTNKSEQQRTQLNCTDCKVISGMGAVLRATYANK